MNAAAEPIETRYFSVVVILPEDYPYFAGQKREVLYCRGCRRWGALHSAHICEQNWYANLDELMAFERSVS